MFGSPTSFDGSPLSPIWEPGFGNPSTFEGSEYAYQGTGFGSPSGGFMAADADPPAPPSFAFAVLSSTGEFGDDGGALVRLYAPGGFPSPGPFKVRLVDADGERWPPTNRRACYAAKAGAGDACMTNRSREFLSFTLPKLPQGAYGIRLEWDDGLSVTVAPEMLLVVPADVSLEAAWAIRGFG